jgi:hypothetical protein
VAPNGTLDSFLDVTSPSTNLAETGTQSLTQSATASTSLTESGSASAGGVFTFDDVAYQSSGSNTLLLSQSCLCSITGSSSENCFTSGSSTAWPRSPRSTTT